MKFTQVFWSSPLERICATFVVGFSAVAALTFLRNSDGELNFIRIWHKSVVCPNGPFTMTELACFCQSGPPQTAGSIVELGWVGLGSLTTSAGAMVDWFPVCGGGLGTLITAMVDWPPRVQFMISQVPPNVHLSTKSHSGLDWNICPPTFTFHKPWWMMKRWFYEHNEWWTCWILMGNEWVNDEKNSLFLSSTLTKKVKSETSLWIFLNTSLV